MSSQIDRSLTLDIKNIYKPMIQSIMEMLVTRLNADLQRANYRPHWTEKSTDNKVECSIKIMLSNMYPQGIGENNKYTNEGWIYFDFGTNEDKAALYVAQAIDELIDWVATKYEKGVGYTYEGVSIRDLKIVPFQGYSQPRELFFHDMIMASFRWERE